MELSQCPANRYFDGEEKVSYDYPSFPLYVHRSKLSLLKNERSDLHFHGDLEYIHIYSGSMGYAINGKNIVLFKGDSLFVNAKAIHSGYAINGEDADYGCVLFSPLLLSFGATMENSLVSPFLSSNVSYVYFKDDEKMSSLLDSMQKIKNDDGSVLSFESTILSIWKETISKFPSLEKVDDDGSIVYLREMIGFIKSNYMDSSLNLSSIASSVNISTSSASRLFRHYLHVSPVSFLIGYRLDVSKERLLNEDISVSTLANDAGYDSASFFIRSFKKRFGLAPKEYKKKETSKER